jgi:molecular chaperone GrpE
MNETPNDSKSTVAADPAPSESASVSEAQELATARAQAAENYDRFVRLTADFDNFRKRAAREREDVRRATYESLLSRLIPVLDNFEMALAAAEQPQASVETIRAGVLMIHQQLRSAFMDAGLEELNAQGQPFDPSLHEAVSQQESVEVPEGTVLHQLRKGYRLRDRLLRPASVIVAKKPEPSGSIPVEQ